MANNELVPPADEDDRKVWLAVSHFDECREIVRRLAEATIKEVNPEAAYKRIAYDAAKIWAEMQEDAKGGGDETGV